MRAAYTYDLHSPEGYKARESEGLSVMLVMLVSYVEEPKATSKIGTIREGYKGLWEVKVSW